MKRSNSNPTTTLSKRRSFRIWLKRVTLPNGRKVEPDMPKGGVFGIPLSMSIKYAKLTVAYIDDDGVKHAKAGAIPIVVAKCASHLKKEALEIEGIFRISGSIKRINTLEYQFDQSSSSYGLDIDWEGYTVHDAATLLRRYLNALPDPVIPFDYYQKFRDVMNNKSHNDTEQRIEALQRLIQSLPTPHQHLLLYLLDTLSLFAAAASETKMNISNLAAIFCPGILRHPDHNTPIQYKISQYVIEFLIRYQSLFTMQLLAPTKKQKTTSTISSNGSEVPPVPSLLPSSYPPPLPLHVVNPSASSIRSSILTSGSNGSFISSPKDMNYSDQLPEQKSVSLHRNVSPSSITAIDSNNQESHVHRITKVPTLCYHLLRQQFIQVKQMIRPWIAKPAALSICFSILVITLIVITYEAYLALALSSFEPLLFFIGLFSYWTLLYKSLPAASSSHIQYTAMIPTTLLSTSENVAVTEKEEAFDEFGYLDTNMDADAEEAMMKDEDIMSVWRDLLTRAWKVSSEESDISNNDDDLSSVMSRSSRFNEEENFALSTGFSSSDDDEDDELGFDLNTLEMYLSQYDQIKKDAQLAKKLQIEEQMARDENNPFLIEDMAIGKSCSEDHKVDRSKTPTDTDKEEWKISVFPR